MVYVVNVLDELMVQLVWRHSCGADTLPVVDRFPAGPCRRLKTVDPLKGNGLGQKMSTFWMNWNLWIWVLMVAGIATHLDSARQWFWVNLWTSRRRNIGR